MTVVLGHYLFTLRYMDYVTADWVLKVTSIADMGLICQCRSNLHTLLESKWKEFPDYVFIKSFFYWIWSKNFL